MRRHNGLDNSSIKADHPSKPPARRHVGFSTPVGQQCGCWFWDLGLFLFTFLRPLCLINGLSTKNSLHLGLATTSGGRIRSMPDSSKLLFVKKEALVDVSDQFPINAKKTEPWNEIFQLGIIHSLDPIINQRFFLLASFSGEKKLAQERKKERATQVSRAGTGLSSGSNIGLAIDKSPLL